MQVEIRRQYIGYVTAVFVHMYRVETTLQTNLQDVISRVFIPPNSQPDKLFHLHYFLPSN